MQEFCKSQLKFFFFFFKAALVMCTATRMQTSASVETLSRHLLLAFHNSPFPLVKNQPWVQVKNIFFLMKFQPTNVKIKKRSRVFKCNAIFHFTKSCNIFWPRWPLQRPPPTSPTAVAHFEFHGTEGPNINTFYSSSHQRDPRPPPSIQPEAVLKDSVPDKMSQRQK